MTARVPEVLSRRFQWRRQAARLTGLLLIAGLFGFARLPQTSAAELETLAAGFAFEETPLAQPTGAMRGLRRVHPDYEKISAWISSVGASVALHDLDGDGRMNDVCTVDPRFDEVLIAPVPRSDEEIAAAFDPRPRFAPFVLDLDMNGEERRTIAPMGCLPTDLDEDGRIDLLVYFWGRPPAAFVQRLEDDERPYGRRALRQTSFVAQDLVPRGERWFTNAATTADLDGDGHLDLVIGNYFPDGARVLDPAATEPAEMQDSMSRAFNGGRNRLLRWTGVVDGRVTFEDASDALSPEVAHGWALAVGAADLDGDLLPEVYFAHDFGPDRLLHNRSRPGDVRFAVVEGRKGLATPASKVAGRDSFKGMGVDFGDVNGDGLPDIYVSNIAESWALEESHFLFLSTGEPDAFAAGRAPYVDRSEELGLSRSGWGWETKLADFDNDGSLEAVQATGFVRGVANRWPELHELAMGNDALVRHPGAWPRFQPGDGLSGHQHNPFFARNAAGRFVDLAAAVGLGRPQVTRGIAIADVDGDGDLDFAVANQWQESYLYRNQNPAGGAFLSLNLLLPVAPALTHVYPGPVPGASIPARPAIGAAAVVTLPDGRRLAAQVDGGNGHSGARSPVLHFGLGQLTAPPETVTVQVELSWRSPDGRRHTETQTLEPGPHTISLGWGDPASHRI